MGEHDAYKTVDGSSKGTMSKFAKSFSISTRISILVCVVILFEFLAFATMEVLFQEAGKVAAKEVEARQALTHLVVISTLMQDAGTSIMKAIVNPTTGETVDYRDAIKELQAEILRLKSLCKDNPEAVNEIRALEGFILRPPPSNNRPKEAVSLADGSERLLQAFVESDMDTYNAHLMRMKKLSDDATKQVRRLKDHATQNLDQFKKENEEAQMRLQIGLAFGLSLNIGLAIWLFMLSREISRKLKILIENILRLNAHKPLLPAIAGDTSDELAKLDRSFRDMAEDLQTTQRKQRAMVDHAADVIFSMDTDGRLSSVNPAALSVWGYTPQELEGRRFTDIIASQQRNAVSQILKQLPEKSSGNQFENTVIHKTGRQVEISWSIHWSRPDQSFFCVAQDMTERKQMTAVVESSERRIRTILEHLPIAVITVDGASRVDLFNPSAEQLFECKADEVVGKEILGLFDERIKQKGLLKTLLSSLGKTVETVVSSPSSTKTIPVEVTVNRFYSHQGERFLIQLRDITERHQIERMKREFIAMISHDVRSPLMSAEFSLSLLSTGVSGELSDKAKAKITDAERNIGYVMTLINGLLEVEQMAEGKLKMRFAETNIRNVLDRAADAARPLAEKRGITLTIPEVSIDMTADEDRLVQVVINLSTNAVKFSPKQSEITVSALAIGEEIEVRVADQGKGISDEAQRNIFKRFERGENVEKIDGLGLGLSICKTIIEQHGGTIGVDSQLGHGSTFWFRVPRETHDNGAQE